MLSMLGSISSQSSGGKNYTYAKFEGSTYENVSGITPTPSLTNAPNIFYHTVYANGGFGQCLKMQRGSISSGTISANISFPVATVEPLKFGDPCTFEVFVDNSDIPIEIGGVNRSYFQIGSNIILEVYWETISGALKQFIILHTIGENPTTILPKTEISTSYKFFRVKCEDTTGGFKIRLFCGGVEYTNSVVLAKTTSGMYNVVAQLEGNTSTNSGIRIDNLLLTTKDVGTTNIPTSSY